MLVLGSWVSYVTSVLIHSRSVDQYDILIFRSGYQCSGFLSFDSRGMSSDKNFCVSSDVEGNFSFADNEIDLILKVDTLGSIFL